MVEGGLLVTACCGWSLFPITCDNLRSSQHHAFGILRQLSLAKNHQCLLQARMASDNISPSESSHLLSSSAGAVHSETQPSHFQRRKPSRTLIIVLILLYLVFLDLGYELIVPAQTRIFEKIYCRLYYEEHDPSLIGSDGKGGVDERWCKVTEVQGEVAMLKGWQLTFDSIGSEC